MKTTKCFALAIAAVVLIVGMTSCEPRTQYDPTTDEKNILLDLPSFVKSVEGQTLDQIKKTLSDRGYKYEGTVDGSEAFTINAKNISIDSLAADGVDMTEFVTSNTSLLQLFVKDNGGVEEATILYCLPQDSATIKYSTIHKNAYASCQNTYPLAIDLEESAVFGMEWEAIAMTLEDAYIFSNILDIYQYMYDNQLFTKEEFEEGKNKLIKEGYKSHNEYLEYLPNLKYIVEILACLGTEEEVYFDYGFADEDMMQMMGIKVFPEGTAIAMGSYYCETEGPVHTPARLQDQSDRLANPRVFQKLSKIFK
jgi:hypothetical protein